MNAVVDVAENVVLNDKLAVPSFKAHSQYSPLKVLQDLEEKRITWETGIYRTSNEALYGILTECHAFTQAPGLTVEQARQRNSALEKFYKERGYTYKTDSPLVTRVIRAVFGDVDRRRISTYSLVLRQAQRQNISFMDLPKWIEEQNGLQEIRLSKSINYVKLETKVELGKQYFMMKPSLGRARSEQLSILAEPDKLGTACVLLAEQQADASFDIRAVMRPTGLLNMAFSLLYNKEKEDISLKEQEIEAARKADGSSASV